MCLLVNAYVSAYLCECVCVFECACERMCICVGVSVFESVC